MYLDESHVLFYCELNLIVFIVKRITQGKHRRALCSCLSSKPDPEDQGQSQRAVSA